MHEAWVHSFDGPIGGAHIQARSRADSPPATPEGTHRCSRLGECTLVNNNWGENRILRGQSGLIRV
eukprot:1042122-Prorocentrum_minimum.AAC.1